MKKLNKITIVILITFSIMMVMSLITSNESVMLLIGDTKCNLKEGHYGKEYVMEHWHYSWTHYLYILMGVCLFIVQIANVVNIVEED